MKNKKIFFLQLLFIILVFFFLEKKINWSLLNSHFNGDLFLGLFLSQFIMICFIMASVWRYKSLMINRKSTFISNINAVVLSMGMNNFLPFRFSDILKSTYLKKYYEVPVSDSLSASIFEKIMDLVALFIIIMILISSQVGYDIYVFILSISLFAISIFLLVKKYMFIQILVKKLFKGVIKDFLLNMLDNFLLYSSSKTLIKSFFNTLVVWTLLVFGIFLFFVVATNFNISFLTLFYTSLAAIVGGMFVILPGSLGTFEGAIILVLQNNGVDFDTSLALALGLRVSLILISVPWSLGIILNHGTGFKQFYYDLKSYHND